MDAELFTSDELEALDSFLNLEDILDCIFAKPNGCGPWRRCQHNPVLKIMPDGTQVSLGCEYEATSEYLLEDNGRQLQIWLCADHADALLNMIAFSRIRKMRN